MAAGIVVIIKNKDGKEVARVAVPEGGLVEIKPDGDGGKPKGDRADINPDRRAAEWVLSLGGTVKVRQDGKEMEIQAAKDLPSTPFEAISLDISNNQKVDNAGLEHLTGLAGLTLLHLNGTRVSDAGLAHLKGLTNLTQLDLSGTQFGDAGLTHLGKLTQLAWLSLRGTRVTDAGLKHLAGLGNLKELDLTGTQVTADAVAGLQKALPKCKIVSPLRSP